MRKPIPRSVPGWRCPTLPLSDRYHNFKEVETGYTARLAVEEAKRCLHCYRQE